jgi:hypothetical protein
MESPESSFFSFPKLSDFNYTSWKKDVKVLLLDRGCWNFIAGTAKPLEEDCSERDKREFEWRKNRAYTTIYQSIERKYQTLIADTEDGKTAWETLKTNFEPSSRARLAGLVDEFLMLRPNIEEETIGIFSKKITDKKLQISEAGFELPELLVCFQLIRHLPAEYENLVQMLYRLKDEEFTVENIAKQLITESGRIELKKRDEGSNSSNVENAYTTKMKANPNSRTSNEGIEKLSSGRVLGQEQRYFKGQGVSRMGPPFTCKFCKKFGHTEAKCFKKLNKKASNTQTFYMDSKSEESTRESTFTASTNDVAEFLVDSAASNHFCSVKK